LIPSVYMCCAVLWFVALKASREIEVASHHLRDGCSAIHIVRRTWHRSIMHLHENDPLVNRQGVQAHSGPPARSLSQRSARNLQNNRR
jgi:hypothetical protein